MNDAYCGIHGDQNKGKMKTLTRGGGTGGPGPYLDVGQCSMVQVPAAQGHACICSSVLLHYRMSNLGAKMWSYATSLWAGMLMYSPVLMQGLSLTHLHIIACSGYIFQKKI
jgi:hypothetical protein